MFVCCFNAYSFTEEQKDEKLKEIRQLKSEGEIVFALLPKLTDEPFFDLVARGCAESAKQHGAHCIYYGSSEKSVRVQTKDFNDLVNAGVDGLAVSGIRDGIIKPHEWQVIHDRNLPIVAFDSPLNDPRVTSYIGTDNYKMGYTLGAYVRNLRPEGGKYCVQFARADSPNHLQRLNGIIDGLTENKSDPLWQTVFGCPLDFNGDYDRAVRQISRILKTSHPDVLFSTGSGAQLAPNKYREALTPYKNKIRTGELIIASIDTLPIQISYLKDGFSTVNVGQRPYDIGDKTFDALWKLTTNQTVSPVIYTGVNLCESVNLARCLEDGFPRAH